MTTAFAWPVVTEKDTLEVLQKFAKRYPRKKVPQEIRVEIDRLKRKLGK